MTTHIRVIALAAALALALPLVASGHDMAPKHKVLPFEAASIHVEKNATDDDTEVVITALAGDDGLRWFTVTSPDRRNVATVLSLDATVRGQREILFESPEPPGEAILAAYPEGAYHFRGQTHRGQRFAGSARLSHQLPAGTVILSPQDESTVEPGPLTIQWSAVSGVTRYLLELENESANPEQALTFTLPPTATSFEVPASVMAPGADYQLSIGTVGANGNVVFVEVSFQTE
jgi:hypothetical protein